MDYSGITEKDIVAARRLQARAELSALEDTLRKLRESMNLEQQLELGAAFGEMRRLLHGNEAPPAKAAAPPNVRQLRAVGRSGPAFGDDAGIVIAPDWMNHKHDNSPKGGGAA